MKCKLTGKNTKRDIDYLLDSPMAHRHGGHIVLTDAMIAATTNATEKCGWLWTEGQHSAHMANGGERLVFPPPWADLVVGLRRMPRQQAESVMSLVIETDNGQESVATLLCGTYRTIRRCDPVGVRVLDLDKHDENDIGETKIVRRFSRPVVEKIKELVTLAPSARGSSPHRQVASPVSIAGGA